MKKQKPDILKRPAILDTIPGPAPIEQCYSLPKTSTFKPKPGRLYFNSYSGVFIRYSEEVTEDGQRFQKAVQSAIKDERDETT